MKILHQSQGPGPKWTLLHLARLRFYPHPGKDYEILHIRAGDPNAFGKDVISKRVKSEEPQYQNYRYADSNKKIICIRPVLIDDILYESATYASQETGIKRMTICSRIKSPNPKFSGYKYADIKTDEIMLPSLV